MSTPTVKFKESSFMLEDYGPFIGWTNGRKSSGWDCPLFEKEEADKIMTNINLLYSNEEDKFAKYDEKSDSYIFPIYNGDELEDVDVFKGCLINTPKGPMKVYEFKGWVWEEG